MHSKENRCCTGRNDRNQFDSVARLQLNLTNAKIDLQCILARKYDLPCAYQFDVSPVVSRPVFQVIPHYLLHQPC